MSRRSTLGKLERRILRSAGIQREKSVEHLRVELSQTLPVTTAKLKHSLSELARRGYVRCILRGITKDLEKVAPSRLLVRVGKQNNKTQREQYQRMFEQLLDR